MEQLRGIALIFALAVVTVSSPVAAEVVDGVVAVVEGEPILMSDLDALSMALSRQGEVVEEPQALLERKVEDILIARRAEELGVDVGPREVEQSIERIAQQNGMSVEELIDTVASQGLPPADYRRVLQQQMLRMRLMQREVEPGIRVDRADLVAYMKQHPNKYGQAPHVQVRLKTSEAVAGCSTECAGRTLTITAATEHIGDVSPLSVPWPDLQPQVQSWIGRNPAEGVARVFGREAPWLVVQYLGHTPSKLVPLEEVYDQVYSEVRREKMERAFRQWLVDLKRNAWVERFGFPQPN